MMRGFGAAWRSESSPPKPEFLCHGPRSPGHPRCPRAQPEEHRPGPASRSPDRDHRAFRVGEVLAGLRHHLRGGSATLRRVLVLLRPPVPGADGEARRGRHRGPLAGHLDRPEGSLAESSLDGWDRHRDLRLPASALRPGGPSPLPPVRSEHRTPDDRSDGGQGPGVAGRHPGHAARAPGPGSQGALPEALPRDSGQGFHPRPGGWGADPGGRGGGGGPGALRPARHRGRGRPDRRQGGSAPESRRVPGDDLGTLWRDGPAGRGGRTGTPVQPAPGLCGLRVVLLRAGPSPLQLQHPLWGVSRLHRPGLHAGGGSQPGGSRRQPVLSPGSPGTLGEAHPLLPTSPPRVVVLEAGGAGRRACRDRPGAPLEEPSGGASEPSASWRSGGRRGGV